jgi:hypothetical protein
VKEEERRSVNEMKVDGKVPSKRDLMRKKQMSIRHNVNLSAWEKWRR